MKVFQHQSQTCFCLFDLESCRLPAAAASEPGTALPGSGELSPTCCCIRAWYCAARFWRAVAYLLLLYQSLVLRCQVLESCRLPAAAVSESGTALPGSGELSLTCCCCIRAWYCAARFWRAVAYLLLLYQSLVLRCQVLESCRLPAVAVSEPGTALPGSGELSLTCCCCIRAWYCAARFWRAVTYLLLLLYQSLVVRCQVLESCRLPAAAVSEPGTALPGSGELSLTCCCSCIRAWYCAARFWRAVAYLLLLLYQSLVLRCQVLESCRLPAAAAVSEPGTALPGSGELSLTCCCCIRVWYCAARF